MIDGDDVPDYPPPPLSLSAPSASCPDNKIPPPCASLSTIVGVRRRYVALHSARWATCMIHLDTEDDMMHTRDDVEE